LLAIKAIFSPGLTKMPKLHHIYWHSFSGSSGNCGKFIKSQRITQKWYKSL